MPSARGTAISASKRAVNLSGANVVATGYVHIRAREGPMIPPAVASPRLFIAIPSGNKEKCAAISDCLAPASKHVRDFGKFMRIGSQTSAPFH